MLRLLWGGRRLWRSITWHATLLSALCVGLLGRCTYDHLEDMKGCRTTGVSWSMDVQPLVQTRCALTGCHVTAETIGNFTTYGGVKAAADSGVLQTVLDLNLMPPLEGLEQCERDRLRAWLSEGAPEN